MTLASSRVASMTSLCYAYQSRTGAVGRGCGEALHPRSAGRGGPEAHGQVREGRDLRVLLRTAPRRRHGGVGHCEVIQPASRGSRYSFANMKCSYTQRLHTRLQNSQSCEPFSECTVSRSHEFAWRVAFFFSSSGCSVRCEGRSTVFSAAGDLSSVTVGARRDSRDSFFSCNVTAFSGMIQKVIILSSCAMELHQKTYAQ